MYSIRIAEPDFTKFNMFLGQKSLLILEQHSNQPIRFEGHVKLRLTIRVWCFYITCHFPLILREKLWVCLKAEIGLGLRFYSWNVVPRSIKYVYQGTRLTQDVHQYTGFIESVIPPVLTWLTRFHGDHGPIMVLCPTELFYQYQ